MADLYLGFWPDEIDAKITANSAPNAARNVRRGEDGVQDGREAASPAEREGQDGYDVQLLGGDGATLAHFTVPKPEPVWTEFVAEDGTLAWHEVAQPVSLDLTQDHPEAVRATIARHGMTATVEVAAERIDPGDCEVWEGRLELDKPLVIVLVAEWFHDRERFWRACAQFRDTLLGASPFDDPDMENKLGVVGLWWPQSGAGLFNTTPDEARRLYGDHSRAFKLANSKRETDLVVVLIDSPKWSGAGGLAAKRPAWASICNFHPQWANMTLHELGHSFGLEDEYVDNGPPGYPYRDSYPNVSDSPDVRHANWRLQASANYAHNPTQYSTGAPPVPAHVVGTFQGALYDSTKYYRPRATCRMRNVADSFCPVCQKVIEDRLGQLGGTG